MYLGIYGKATDSPLLFWHLTVAIPTRMRMVRLPKLNRVTQVTAADGGIARYFHDANGDLNRLVTRQLPALPGVPADLVTTA